LSYRRFYRICDAGFNLPALIEKNVRFAYILAFTLFQVKTGKGYLIRQVDRLVSLL